jgi:ribosomal-protein-alanine N-acetyltransferase
MAETFSPASEEKDVLEVAEIEKERFSNPYGIKTLRFALSSQNQVILLCRKEEKAVGYIHLGLAADEAEVYGLAVRKEEEGKGYGRKLMEAAFKYLQERQVKTVFLEVRPSNLRALSLYKNLGFQWYRTRKAYYDNGEDGLCLLKGI